MLIEGVPHVARINHGTIAIQHIFNQIFSFWIATFAILKMTLHILFSSKSLYFVLNNVECNLNVTANCFENSYIKINSDKCNLRVPGHKVWKIWAKIGSEIIYQSNSNKLLVIVIDNQHKFSCHIFFLSAIINKTFLLF